MACTSSAHPPLGVGHRRMRGLYLHLLRSLRKRRYLHLLSLRKILYLGSLCLCRNLGKDWGPL